MISGDGWSSECYSTFEDGKFTGKIYMWTYPESQEPETEENPVCEYLGTVSGTYECSGTGTKDCTVTVTVTELPEIVTEIEKNKPFVFETENWE